jgi:hypothetical protein
VLFLDLLVKERSIRERDLSYFTLTDLDWFKLSGRLPLSLAALERHAGDVDWARVSESHMYAKDGAFVRKFAERLHWPLVRHADSAEVARQLFERGLLCMDAALSNRLVHVRDLGRHIEALRASPRLSALVVDSYCARDANALGLDVPEHLRHAVAAKCISEGFVPTTVPLVSALESICMERNGDGPKCSWANFLRACAPDQAFVSAHVVREGRPVSLATWAALSSLSARLSPELLRKHADRLALTAVLESAGRDHVQFDEAVVEAHAKKGDARAKEAVSRHVRLSPGFVDRNADLLDWYTLCEFQVLPDWLLRKHIDRLNWGQLSRYQDLSQAFESEFAARINDVKRGAYRAEKRNTGTETRKAS